MRLREMIFSVAVLAAGAFVLSCVDGPYIPAEPAATPTPATPAAGTPTATATINTAPFQTATVTGGIDGTIMTFKWRVNGANLDCIMSAPAAGWVAVGFNTSMTKGGNVIIGYVDGAGAHARDDNTSGNAHSGDAVQNISGLSGTEAEGITEIYFTIPLNSGDADDIALIPGNTVWIFMAFSQSDDFSSMHDDRGYVQITL